MQEYTTNISLYIEMEMRFLLEWGCQITNPSASMRCHNRRCACHDSNTKHGLPDPSHERVVKSRWRRVDAIRIASVRRLCGHGIKVNRIGRPIGESR